jgi:nucleoside-diphosphate-sugar epimerase/DNA-binding NarL/FixJ family response regulator
MPKLTTRIIALFLVPCLLTEPLKAVTFPFESAAFAPISRRSTPVQYRLNQEAILAWMTMSPHRIIHRRSMGFHLRAQVGAMKNLLSPETHKTQEPGPTDFLGNGDWAREPGALPSIDRTGSKRPDPELRSRMSSSIAFIDDGARNKGLTLVGLPIPWPPRSAYQLLTEELVAILHQIHMPQDNFWFQTAKILIESTLTAHLLETEIPSGGKSFIGTRSDAYFSSVFSTFMSLAYTEKHERIHEVDQKPSRNIQLIRYGQLRTSGFTRVYGLSAQMFGSPETRWSDVSESLNTALSYWQNVQYLKEKPLHLRAAIDEGRLAHLWATLFRLARQSDSGPAISFERQNDVVLIRISGLNAERWPHDWNRQAFVENIISGAGGRSHIDIENGSLTLTILLPFIARQSTVERMLQCPLSRGLPFKLTAEGNTPKELIASVKEHYTAAAALKLKVAVLDADDNAQIWPLNKKIPLNARLELTLSPRTGGALGIFRHFRLTDPRRNANALKWVALFEGVATLILLVWKTSGMAPNGLLGGLMHHIILAFHLSTPLFLYGPFLIFGLHIVFGALKADGTVSRRLPDVAIATTKAGIGLLATPFIILAGMTTGLVMLSFWLVADVIAVVPHVLLNTSGNAFAEGILGMLLQFETNNLTGLMKRNPLASFYERRDTYAVTGAGGFIGRWLVNALQENAVGLIRFLPSLNRPKVNETSLLLGDLLDPITMRQLMSRSSAIYHLAAIPGEPAVQNDPVKAFATNVLGTALVTKLAGSRRVIFASSIAVYLAGGLRDGLITERSELPVFNQPVVSQWVAQTELAFDTFANDYLANPSLYNPIVFTRQYLEMHPIPDVLRGEIYGLTKFIGERFVMKAPQGMSVRLPNVYGPGDMRDSKISTLVHAAVQEGSLAHPYKLWPDQRQYLYVEDLAVILQRLASMPVMPKVINVAPPDLIDAHTVAKTISSAANRPSDFITVDDSAEGRQRVRNFKLNTSRLRHLIGPYNFISFETGIRGTVSWEQPKSLAAPPVLPSLSTESRRAQSPVRFASAWQAFGEEGITPAMNRFGPKEWDNHAENRLLGFVHKPDVGGSNGSRGSSAHAELSPSMLPSIPADNYDLLATEDHISIAKRLEELVNNSYGEIPYMLLVNYMRATRNVLADYRSGRAPISVENLLKLLAALKRFKDGGSFAADLDSLKESSRARILEALALSKLSRAEFLNKCKLQFNSQDFQKAFDFIVSGTMAGLGPETIEVMVKNASAILKNRDEISNSVAAGNSADFVQYLSVFTKSEQDTLEVYRRGWEHKEIRKRLGIAIATVNDSLREIRTKLNTPDILERDKASQRRTVWFIYSRKIVTVPSHDGELIQALRNFESTLSPDLLELFKAAREGLSLKEIAGRLRTTPDGLTRLISKLNTHLMKNKTVKKLAKNKRHDYQMSWWMAATLVEFGKVSEQQAPAVSPNGHQASGLENSSAPATRKNGKSRATTAHFHALLQAA